jgi:hypothetical protein
MNDVRGPLDYATPQPRRPITALGLIAIVLPVGIALVIFLLIGSRRSVITAPLKTNTPATPTIPSSQPIVNP